MEDKLMLKLDLQTFATKSFDGKLRPNEIFAALFNMIISQHVFSDNIVHNYALVDEFKVEGTMYGDTKLYYATDVLESHEWLNDEEAANLLNIKRPEPPEQQAVTISNFRQIEITVDNYLTKRAWSTEDAYAQFTSVILSWVPQTKRIYEITLFNSFIGTHKAEKETQSITIDVAAAIGTTTDVEAKNRIEAQTIAKALSNLNTKLKDYSRDYNDYGNLRSYAGNELMFIWNDEIVNKITDVDLPTIYHKENLFNFEKTLPARYFGDVLTEGGTSDGNKRTLVEGRFNEEHLFPGDLIPSGATYKANEAYTPNEHIICKIVHKRGVPFMDSMEVATSFFNPKSLTTNHYLTFGYSDLAHLYNYPFITVFEKSSDPKAVSKTK